jgi:hypothetical protein
MSSQIVAKAIEAGGTLPEILKRVFVRLLQEVERDRELRAVLELELFTMLRIAELEDSRQKQLETGEQLLAGISQAMEEGIQAGYLRKDFEPITMARSFLAFQKGAIQLWLVDPKSFSLQLEAEAMAEIYLKGILNDG